MAELWIICVMVVMVLVCIGVMLVFTAKAIVNGIINFFKSLMEHRTKGESK